MANQFRSNLLASLKDDDSEIYVAPRNTETVIVGMSVANTDNDSEATITIQYDRQTRIDSDGETQPDPTSLVHKIPVPLGSTIVPVGGVTKVAVEAGDRIRVEASGGQVDIQMSYLEIVNGTQTPVGLQPNTPEGPFNVVPSSHAATLNTNRYLSNSAVVSFSTATWTLDSGPRWAGLDTGNLLSLSGYTSGDELWAVTSFSSMGTTFNTRSTGGATIWASTVGGTTLDGPYDNQMFIRTDTGAVNNGNNGSNDQESGYTSVGAVSSYHFALYFNGTDSAEYWISTNSGSTWLGPVQSHQFSANIGAISLTLGRRDDDGSDQSMTLLDPGDFTLPTPTI